MLYRIQNSSVNTRTWKRVGTVKFARASVSVSTVAGNKDVRAAGQSAFNDAQLPTDGDVPTITTGGNAEYQIVVTNCGPTTVTNVKVTDDDTTAACATTIGTMAAGAVVTYTNTTVTVSGDPTLAATLVNGVAGCLSTNVQLGRTSNATVTGTGPGHEALTATDPVSIKVKAAEATTTTSTTTTAPPVVTFPPTPPAFPVNTLVPTTVAPTTVAPTTAAPTTMAPTTTAPATTVAPAVSILGVQVAQPISDAPLAVTGSNSSRPMMMLSMLILLVGCGLLLASKSGGATTARR